MHALQLDLIGLVCDCDEHLFDQRNCGFCTHLQIIFATMRDGRRLATDTTNYYSIKKEESKIWPSTPGMSFERTNFNTTPTIMRAYFLEGKRVQRKNIVFVSFWTISLPMKDQNTYLLISHFLYLARGKSKSARYHW